MPTIKGTSRADIIDARGRTDDLTIQASGGNDTIYGGSGTDSIYGGGGNDRIYASPYDKLIDGGSGNDTVDFSLYVADSRGYGVDARLWGAHVGLWPGDGQWVPATPSGTIKNVENLVGSNYDDALMGNTAINRLSGGAGDDYVIAYGSGDFLTGGGGADIFDVESAGAKTTITDFNYAEGDRLQFLYSPNISWSPGSAPDANGVVRAGWIGTYVDHYGNTEQLIVLGASQPSSAWIVSLG